MCYDVYVVPNASFARCGDSILLFLINICYLPNETENLIYYSAEFL